MARLDSVNRQKFLDQMTQSGGFSGEQFKAFQADEQGFAGSQGFSNAPSTRKEQGAFQNTQAQQGRAIDALPPPPPPPPPPPTPPPSQHRSRLWIRHGRVRNLRVGSNSNRNTRL